SHSRWGPTMRPSARKPRPWSRGCGERWTSSGPVTSSGSELHPLRVIERFEVHTRGYARRVRADLQRGALLRHRDGHPCEADERGGGLAPAARADAPDRQAVPHDRLALRRQPAARVDLEPDE